MQSTEVVRVLSPAAVWNWPSLPEYPVILSSTISMLLDIIFRHNSRSLIVKPSSTPATLQRGRDSAIVLQQCDPLDTCYRTAAAWRRRRG